MSRTRLERVRASVDTARLALQQIQDDLAAGEVILQALQQPLTAVPKVQVGVDTSSGVFAVVDQPVRTYIASHAAGLAVEASTVYTLWLLTGIVGLVAMWTAWGAATVWMVWTATRQPAAPSRPGSPSSPGRSCPRSRCAA
ncbi:hypothetical protein [Streptomyces mirabilis]|uniref:hypothetical protein n=1 Tax=Streptomyces mirabilis TaxID=68239 RepID=UPI00332F1904